ncbi:MAG: YwiC-like family protein [Acidimicrobiales bacterium]
MTSSPALTATPTTDGDTSPQRRSALRSVALPTEHGGWGLTLEPALLGLLVRWSAAGLCLAVVAFVAFLARTPLKVVLVDARRHRTLPRTRLARSVLAAEIVAMVLLVAGAVLLDASAFLAPLVLMAPLAGVDLWFAMRSRSRRLLPELAGAVAVGGVVAVVTLAGGADLRLAAACWLILAARSLSAVVTVRDLVGHLHGHSRHPGAVLAADVAALAVAGAAAVVEPATVVGAIAVLVAIATQRLLDRRPAPRAVVIGIRQTMLGLGVVVATAIGVLWT